MRRPVGGNVGTDGCASGDDTVCATACGTFASKGSAARTAMAISVFNGIPDS
jgi:hypothetical protein